MREELPATAQARMAEIRASGTWGSSLTCGEFAAIRSADFEPVGQVLGAAVYAAGSASGSGCPAAGGSRPGPSATQVSGQGSPASFGPLVHAMYQARRTAIGRMTAECAQLGGHGVVGVRLSRGSFPLGGLEFIAIGTAVRAPGAAYGRREPFTCDLSGQDFAKLIMAGWVPAGLALGVSIGSRHDDRATARQARWGAGNAEVAGWTELVSESRRDARRQLESDVRRLGGEGVVIAAMQLRVSQRDCPVTMGRRDHIVEATLIGTAIARFSPAGRAGPALGVMPLGPQRAPLVLASVGMTWQPELDDVRRRRDLAEQMGGPDKIRRQHEAGRLTVRERLAVLLDEDSFDEIGTLAGTAVYDGEGELTEFRPANFVVGTGRIDGRKVVVGGDDFTIRGGAADAAIAGKQVYAEQLANQMRLPLIRLIEGTGGGGSVKMLEQMGHTYVPVNPGWDYVVDNLSTVPVVAAGLGPVAGLGAARLCIAHLSVLVDGIAQLFVAGPPVVRSGAGEDVTKEQLGGAVVHARNAAVDLMAASEHEAFGMIRRFLSYLPQSAYQRPPVISCTDPAGRREDMLLSAVPRDRRQPYRIRDILHAVFDLGSVMEVQGYGGSIVTALARLDGHPVGVVASDPYAAGGCLTVEGAEAMTRLSDLCSTFHLPVVTFTDQPGLLIGTRAEQRATIRHGVRAISAVYQSAGPGAEIIVRRVFGVGGAGMTNRHRLTRRWAWPSADWGSLPVEGGIEAAYRAELERAEDPAATLAGIRARLDAVRSPQRTAERFGIEEIIDPRQTRPLLCDWVYDAYATLPASPGKPSFGTRP